MVLGRSRSTKKLAERLLALYHRRLKNAFGHVVRPSLVKNTKGMPLYYLMWASSNRRGVAYRGAHHEFGRENPAARAGITFVQVLVNWLLAGNERLH